MYYQGSPPGGFDKADAWALARQVGIAALSAALTALATWSSGSELAWAPTVFIIAQAGLQLTALVSGDTRVQSNEASFLRAPQRLPMRSVQLKPVNWKAAVASLAATIAAVFGVSWVL